MINRMAYYISQGRVDTSNRRCGQFCRCVSQFGCKFTSVSVCQKLSKHNAVWQSYWKIEGCNFLPHSIYTWWGIITGPPSFKRHDLVNIRFSSMNRSHIIAERMRSLQIWKQLVFCLFFFPLTICVLSSFLSLFLVSLGLYVDIYIFTLSSAAVRVL